MELVATIQSRRFNQSLRTLALMKVRQGQRILMRGGTRIYRASQIQVPRRTGNLALSGSLDSRGSGSSFEVIITYGASYASYVERAPRSRRFINGKSRFLSDPVRANRRRIYAELRRALR